MRVEIATRARETMLEELLPIYFNEPAHLQACHETRAGPGAEGLDLAEDPMDWGRVGFILLAAAELLLDKIDFLRLSFVRLGSLCTGRPGDFAGVLLLVSETHILEPRSLLLDYIPSDRAPAMFLYQGVDLIEHPTTETWNFGASANENNP